jgi:hypothetical protein
LKLYIQPIRKECYIGHTHNHKCPFYSPFSAQVKKLATELSETAQALAVNEYTVEDAFIRVTEQVCTFFMEYSGYFRSIPYGYGSCADLARNMVSTLRCSGNRANISRRLARDMIARVAITIKSLLLELHDAQHLEIQSSLKKINVLRCIQNFPNMLFIN